MTSTVYIAKNVYGGDGMGRLGDGRVVFVKGAWAGEQVKAKMVQEAYQNGDTLDESRFDSLS